MAILRFEPIATQIAKLASPALLFPEDILARIDRAELDVDDPAWAPEVREFMAHYTVVVAAGHLLLGAPPFERLARLSEAQEEQYQPGGPPMSPVYDSYSVQHILAEVPQGLAGETPYSVLARLSCGDPRRARLCELAHALAASHLDLYRVNQVSAWSAELAPVRGGSAFSVHLTGPFLRSGDQFLGRVLAFGSQRFLADTPYLLDAPASDWREYFERVVREHGREQPARAARAEGPSQAKLSQKQAARRRKEQKHKASQHTPEEIVTAHLRYGKDETFWLEFILDAYAGERSGVVRLAGVPDLPESLPHSEHYAPSSAEAGQGSPLQRVRRSAIAIASREGILEREGRALVAAARSLGAQEFELHEADRYLLVAYCTLGARSERGATALELLRLERELDPEERAVVDSIERGHFAVLRVDHIRLDEGLDAFDVLRGQRVQVQERLATRELALGDLVLGWLCDAGDGVWQLEGGVLHVPAQFAPALSERALELRDQRRAELPNETEARRHVALVLPLIAHVQHLRENPPLSVA